VLKLLKSRDVRPLPDLVKIVRKNIAKESRNALPNGILCLKGGNLEGELQPFRRIVESQELSTWFSEEWFKEKHVIYLPL
jgi:16S rRNA (guanine527-N7)-methyltransferase